MSWMSVAGIMQEKTFLQGCTKSASAAPVSFAEHQKYPTAAPILNQIK